MRRPAAITVAVSLLASSGAVLMVPSATANRTHRSRCLPHGARTIALDRRVRVYSIPEYIEGVQTKREGIYVCLFERGTSLSLEPSRGPKPPIPELERITLAGAIVAFVDFQHGVDSGCDVIEVADVARGTGRSGPSRKLAARSMPASSSAKEPAIWS